MKTKLFCVLFLMVFITSANAQKKDLMQFWDSVRMSNDEYLSYQKNRSKLKNSSLNEFLQIKKESARFYESVDSRDTAFANTLSTVIFDKPIFKSVVVFDDEYEPNAGVDANGHLEIGVTLYSMLDDDEFTAVIAHEAAHIILKHSEIAYFNYMKEQRNAKIGAAIMAGLHAAGVMYGEYMRAANLGTYNADRIYGITGNTIAISKAFERNIESMKKLYSRSQEIDADFIAAAYLDYVGIGREKLISALNKIKVYYEDLGYNTKTMNSNSTHPSLDERIRSIDKNRRPLGIVDIYD